MKFVEKSHHLKRRGRKMPWWGGWVLPYKRPVGMCHWMGSHFHDSVEYNGVMFSRILKKVTRIGSHFFGTLRVRKLFA